MHKMRSALVTGMVSVAASVTLFAGTGFAAVGGTIHGDNVNIRAQDKNGTPTEVIGQAQDQDRVSVDCSYQKAHGSWYRITHGNVTGLVSAEFMQPDVNAPACYEPAPTT